jgi:hypothetical protein
MKLIIKNKIQTELFSRIHNAFANVNKPTWWGVEHNSLGTFKGKFIYDDYTEATKLCKGLHWRTLDYDAVNRLTFNQASPSVFTFVDPIVYHWLLPGLLIVALNDKEKYDLGAFLYEHFEFSMIYNLSNHPERYDIYTAEQIEVMADVLEALRARHQDINEAYGEQDECTPKIIRLREFASAKSKSKNYLIK